MKVLAANLKHFYQCRSMWLLYLALLMFASPMLVVRYIPPRGSLIYIFISLFVGLITADLQKNVLAKPFSFCMPRHRDISRRLIMAIGVSVNLLLGMRFFGYHGLEFPYVLLAILASGFVGMMCYLSAIHISFSSINSSYLLSFPLLFLGVVFVAPGRFLEDMVVSSPLPFIAIGMLVCAVAWRWLGSESVARKYCGQMVMGVGENWNLTKAEKYWRKKAAQKLSKKGSAILESLEGFFLARMSESRPFSVSRSIQGNLYVMLSRAFGPWWRLYVLVMIGVVLFLGYFSPGERHNFHFLLPACGLIQLDLIPYGSMLLPCGRSEKYRCALFLGLTVTLLSTLLIVILAVMSGPLVSILPDIAVKGRIFSYHPLNVQGFHISLFMTPIVLIIATVLPKKNFLRIGFIVVLVQIWINPTFSEWSDPLSLIGVPGIMALVAASWIGFVVIMGYHCRRRSLVGQGK